MSRTPRAAAIAVALALTLAATGCTPEQETLHVTIGADLALTAEHARTNEQQRTGLAGRDSLADGTGMLFTFTPPATQRVWMAGMRFSIDIAWIRDGQIVATDTLPICTELEVNDCPRWESPGDVDALLETSAGTLTDITPGTPVTITPKTP